MIDMKRYRRRYYRRGYYCSKFYYRECQALYALGSLIGVAIIVAPFIMLYQGIKWLILGFFGLVARFPITSTTIALIVLYLTVVAPRFNKRKVKYVSTDEVEHKDNSDFYKNNGIF